MVLKILSNFSLPFDQHTCFGFLLVNILQAINVYAYFIILIGATSYFLSICFYVEAICEDFEAIFVDLDKSITLDAIGSNIISAITLQNCAAK